MSSSSFFRSAGTLVVVIALIVIVQHLLTQRSDSFSPSPSPPRYGTFDSQAIANLPSAAQNALNFIPQGNGNTFTVATLVESAANLTVWEGSNDFPGKIVVSPAPHGATEINWQLPAHTGLGAKPQWVDLRISADGTLLWTENGWADSILP